VGYLIKWSFEAVIVELRISLKEELMFRIHEQKLNKGSFILMINE